MHRLQLSSCLRAARRLVLAGCLAGPAAQAQTPTPQTPLPAPLARTLQQAGIAPDAVSLLVWPVDAPAPRLAHGAAAPRPVASVMKLFTTGAALQTLGPAWTWSTEAALGGRLRPDGTLEGALYLRGQGDPALLQEQVGLMLARWRSAGLRTIAGDLVLDRGRFVTPPHDPDAFDGRGLRPYNAGPDALLLNHQSITLRILPDAARPGQLRAALSPTLEGVELSARLTPVAGTACGDWRAALTLRMEALPGWHHHGLNRWRVRLEGPYPLACGEQDWPVLWQGDGPGDFTTRLLAQAWQEAGGHLQGDIRAGTWPTGLPTWQRWTSPPLSVVVRDINKFSNNVMARQLFLTLAMSDANAGAEPPPATLEAARSRVGQIVREATADANGRSPCEGEALVLDNGSGLSRLERSSALCLGGWLRTVWHSPIMPELLASLPLTGVDGTARRWSGASGHAHIKTGSLDGVSAIAGYVDGQSGHRHIVVGIVQDPRSGAARPVLDALLDWARQDL